MRLTLNPRLLGLGDGAGGGNGSSSSSRGSRGRAQGSNRGKLITSDLLLALNSPIQGFDPYRILLQIVSLQALHYLVLCLVLPPCTALFPGIQPDRLDFQGGKMNLGLVLDWREISGLPTTIGRIAWVGGHSSAVGEVSLSMGESASEIATESERWDQMQGLDRWWDSAAYLLPAKPTTEGKGVIKVVAGDVGWIGFRPASVHTIDEMSSKAQASSIARWYLATAYDPARGWSIVLAWLLTGIADVYLLALLVRRPTHILDHTLTLHFWHAVLTTAYTRHLPRSLFYWMVMCVHAGGCVVWAEALAIGREMKGWSSSLGGGGSGDIDDDDDEINDGDSNADVEAGEGREEGQRLLGHERGNSHQPTMKPPPVTHVVFDTDDVLDSDQDDDVTKKQRKGGGTGRNAKQNGHSSEAIEMKRLD